jgi:hypothetical protein
MDERHLYRELVAWLRSHHPLIFSKWESERKRLESRKGSESLLLQASSDRSQPGLDQLAPDADAAAITRALQQELVSLGIGGGTPGVTSDGTPCVELEKKGVYGRTYKESVTVARLRDQGYRRRLKQEFG